MHSYLNLCTQMYDLDKPDAPEDALAFYQRYAEAARGPILEPMCGSGRFLVPLAQRGFDIDGADASPHMLAACRDKLARHGLNANVYEQFVHELDLPRKYRLVFIAAGSFSLLIDPGQVRDGLRRIAALTLPGGTFVVEVEAHKPREHESWPWGGKWIDRPDGAKIVINWLGRYDADQCIAYNIHRYDLIRDNQLLVSEFEDFNLRFYGVDEFTKLLEEAGFARVRAIKTYADQPPDESDETVVFECVRP